MAGVGIEKDEAGEYVLAIHLDASAAKNEKELPNEIDGVPVRYIRSGPFRKLDHS